MPVPQEIHSLWNGPESPFIKALLKMVQYLNFNLHLAPFSRTGKMPVPQRINFLWGGHPARP
ncbi:hypothetical protein [Microcoleus sp. B5-D4]|uniref:hypothetical protein n=1 Tax=Microcoleus sp. B5-D4 TaxID=2818681 RepID=UPI002FD7395D